MRAYTYQIGDGADDTMAHPVHAEALYADSLGEAIDKAKALTNHRPPHAKENRVRLVEVGAEQHPLWAASVDTIRQG